MSFKKLLIANRGEIAIRIARAAARNFVGLVGDADMQRQPIVSRKDRNRRNAGIRCGPRDANGDFAAIGDQELLERHKGLSLRAR